MLLKLTAKQSQGISHMQAYRVSPKRESDWSKERRSPGERTDRHTNTQTELRKMTSWTKLAHKRKWEIIKEKIMEKENGEV